MQPESARQARGLPATRQSQPEPNEEAALENPPSPSRTRGPIPITASPRTRAPTRPASNQAQDPTRRRRAPGSRWARRSRLPALSPRARRGDEQARNAPPRPAPLSGPPLCFSRSAPRVSRRRRRRRVGALPPAKCALNEAATGAAGGRGAAGARLRGIAPPFRLSRRPPGRVGRKKLPPFFATRVRTAFPSRRAATLASRRWLGRPASGVCQKNRVKNRVKIKNTH